MSQTDPDNLEKYRGTAGAEVKTADVSSDDHALKQKLGQDANQERIYDAKLAGERFVQFYDDSAAAIREYLSNAETACIRRAKQELLNTGFTSDDIPNEVTELLALAESECGYEPIIEVTYNRKADDTRLIIEDNGIGISTEEYQVVQRIGYSASHMEGTQLGNFGTGWMSGFQLTSVNGLFKMETRSFLTDEAYGTVEYVANFEYRDVEPSEYGTRFEFPAFGEEAKNIDIPSKVEEFADGMRINVLYRDFDHDGQETFRSDDFLPTNIEDDYSDDSLVVIAENEFFKAVMSPDSKESGRGRTTYNITMPIRRNTDAFGSEPKFNAPWKWDFRGKREDGPIVFCESDESLVGLVPKEDSKYDRLVDEMKDDCVPMSEVPDDAIVMPDPASSRDSYKNGHDDFWQFVSDKLMDEWSEVAVERFEDLNTWQDFLDMDRDEKNALFRAYSAFGPDTVDNEPDTIQETLEENLGVSVPLTVCEKLDASRSNVSVVTRDHHRAHTKGATYREKIWKVIDEAPDGIYMGKSVSQKKAEIVWGLGETHFVRLDSGDSYGELTSTWDWEKAKDLPNRDLKEKLPELDDDVAEKFENVSDSASNNTGRSSTGGNGQDPTTYRGKTRVGVNRRRYFTTHKLDDLVETLKDDGDFSAGRYSCQYLIIHKDDKSARDVAHSSDRRKGVAAMRLPKYAYDYMVNQPNVYESMDELQEDLAGAEVTLSDGTTHDILTLPESDCLLVTGGKVEDEYEGNEDRLVELLGYDSNEFTRYTWLDASDFNGVWGAETDATVIKTSNGESFRDFSDYDHHNKNFDDLYMLDKLGDTDNIDSEKYDALFGYQYGEPSGPKLRTLVDIAEAAGLGDQ